MDFVKKIKGIRGELIIVSIALFVLGLFLVIFPDISQVVICKGIGIAFCVWGVLRLITYFRISKEEVLSSFGLVQGVTLIAFGVFFVMRPEAISVFFGTALSIVIIVDGILKLQYGIEFFHMKSGYWWIELIGAFVMVIMGIIALCNPFATTSALMIFVGIVFMVEGLWDLVSIVRISRFVKKVADDIRRPAMKSQA